MPELIDRETLLHELCGMCCAGEKYKCRNPWGECDEAMLIKKQPTIEAEPVRKREMSEADRKKCEEWCKDCEHIEMCKWYPFGGCDFRLLPKPEQPTIEPEVRHGRWIQSDALDYKDPNGVIHIHGMCSCCRLIYDFRDMTSRFNFCPNCGARMDATDTNVGGKD